MSEPKRLYEIRRWNFGRYAHAPSGSKIKAHDLISETQHTYMIGLPNGQKERLTKRPGLGTDLPALIASAIAYYRVEIDRLETEIAERREWIAALEAAKAEGVHP